MSEAPNNIARPSIQSALRWGSERICQLSDSSKLDSEILLAYCLQKPRSFLYSWPEAALNQSQWSQFQALIALRLKPTPIAYLLGEKEFYSLKLFTTSDTLVPRPETELLVDKTLELLGAIPKSRVLELGTGTGAIAIALKKTQANLTIIATDVAPETLAIAQKNAAFHKLDIEFQCSNWYQKITAEKQFDAIVSNPPYIAATDPYLSQGDLPAEPQTALSPGETGLEAIKVIIAQAPKFLKPKAFLLLEHGYDQQHLVAELFLEAGFINVFCHFDFNQLPRVSCAQLP